MDHLTTPVILCDVDGVLADFEDAVRWYLTRFDITLPPWTTWDVRKCMSFYEASWVTHAMNDHRFPGDIEPYPEAGGVVKALASMGTLVAVTADAEYNAAWIPQRRYFLKSLGFQPKNIIFAPTETKHIIGGDVLIEDNIDTLGRWAKLHPQSLGVLVARSYNDADYTQKHRDLGIVRLPLSEVAGAVSAFLGKPLHAP